MPPKMINVQQQKEHDEHVMRRKGGARAAGVSQNGTMPEVDTRERIVRAHRFILFVSLPCFFFLAMFMGDRR